MLELEGNIIDVRSKRIFAGKIIIDKDTIDSGIQVVSLDPCAGLKRYAQSRFSGTGSTNQPVQVIQAGKTIASAGDESRVNLELQHNYSVLVSFA